MITSNSYIDSSLLNRRYYDDGTEFPGKFFYSNTTWDQATHTFTGVIDHGDHLMSGIAYEVWTLVFEEDYQTSIANKSFCEEFDANDNLILRGSLL